MKLPRSIKTGRSPRPKSRKRGSAVLEITVALAALLILAVLLLKATLNVTKAQQWTIVQAMTDSFMTQETAVAKRAPFRDITGDAAGWPVTPTVNTSTVILGRLPGGSAITGTLQRSRVPDPNNLGSDWGTGTGETNPARMEIWQLQSYLTYEIGGRDYVKSRTVVRAR